MFFSGDSSGNVVLGAAGIDAVMVEAGLNARQALAINSAALAGVLAGAVGGTITIAGAGVVANRSVVTINPPD